MKKFTKNLMLVAAVASSLTASAEANWQLYPGSVDFKVAAQASCGIMGDFNNNDHLDIYYSGHGVNPIYDHPGTLSWQASSNMLYNNGDGTFTEDIISTEGKGEYFDITDESGNVIGQGEYYQYVDPKHGIWPATYPHFATIDYNNDGLLDLLVAGKKNNDWAANYFDRIPEQMRTSCNMGEFCMVLYKNNGDGTFSIEPNCNLPFVVPDRNNGNANFFNTIAWGDYDHDGFVDLAFCGLTANSEPGEPNRIAQLWRNIDGTGSFQQMNIAETWGGAWTDAVTEGEGDEKVEVIPAREMEGWFLFLSGNVTMADINNDGWLDLVFDGWANKVSDGIYEGGSNGRVYLNVDNGEGGRKFIDVTERNGAFYLTRAGSTQLVDLDNDGYLDLINGGYGDHGLGWKTLFFHNNLGDDTTIENTKIFDYGDSMSAYGLPEEECMKLAFRDFDGDGILDVIYVGKRDEKTYYGDLGSTYTEGVAFPIRGFNGEDGGETFGDLNGDGLCERFQNGYCWVHDNAEMDGTNYREILGCGDWAFGKFLWYNTTETEIVAPAAPANVTTAINEDDHTITVTWEDADAYDNPNCAYNVVVVSPSGKVIANLPVNPETGFIKVAENKNIAVRPGVQSYTIAYNEIGEYKAGVQTVSLINEKFSSIAWGNTVVAGVEGISNDNADNQFSVSINGEYITVNATFDDYAYVYDVLGRPLAVGKTNTALYVPEKGIIIVQLRGESVKVVK
ncbi:MAG: VCBS repeat-containing protein [Bacteroidales bacterium]|nr:VCBS repeat-containing protein [Bacteroidales bacterium]